MSIKSKKKATIDKAQCVACGCCVTACPLAAIWIDHGSFAVVENESCIGCGKCSAACPACIIRIEVTE